MLVVGTPIGDWSVSPLFVAEFTSSKVDYLGKEYVYTNIYTTYPCCMVIPHVLEEFSIDAPPNIDADYWSWLGCEFVFNECTRPRNVINCPFEHLESLFTAHIGYEPKSVMQDPFPPQLFQCLQHIWNEYEAPRIKERVTSMKRRYEEELRLCQESEKKLLDMLVDGDLRVVFAHLNRKLSQGIVLEYILPHFNVIGVVKNMHTRCGLAYIINEYRRAQEQVDQLGWKL